MGGVKNHTSFDRIIQSLKYSLFEVVDQHLCGTQNLVQIDLGISEEMRGVSKHTHTERSI